MLGQCVRDDRFMENGAARPTDRRWPLAVIRGEPLSRNETYVNVRSQLRRSDDLPVRIPGRDHRSCPKRYCEGLEHCPAREVADEGDYARLI